MQAIKIQTDQNQRELSEHGTAQFPLSVTHDYLNDYFERYVRCHWHEELEIPVVIHGKIRYQVKEHSFDLNPGDGIVINSRVPHTITPLGNDEPVMLTTIFSPSLLYGTPASTIYQNLLNPYMNTPELAGILLHEHDVETLKQIDILYQESNFGVELKIKGLLCNLFFDLLSRRRNMLSPVKVSNEESLSRLKILLDSIHENYAEQLSLTDLASKISISKEGCCRFFKNMTGKTISQYLEEYRVSQGILLLQNDQYSVMQVAYLVGFGNPGRFSAAFARRMNCTPSQYRKTIAHHCIHS
ncbi:MAG: AraC family transcriptional regulator [Dorea sp.]|nr:AraC family transcriptional regulator [Dorea sp.]